MSLEAEIKVRVLKETKEELERIAAEMGEDKGVSDVVRLAIREYLTRKRALQKKRKRGA